MSTWYQRHPRWALSAVVVVGVALAVGAAETVLRVVAPPPPVPTRGERSVRLREWEPALDLERAPPPEWIARADGLTDRAVHFATDTDGWILPARAREAPDRTVVFLGGSTTECYFVADSLRFPALAGRQLGERLGLRVDALNGGRSGNHAMHSVELLVGKAVPEAPDVVVLMHAVNDLTTLLREGDYWNDNASRGLVAPGACRTVGCDLRAGVRGVTTMLVPALRYRLQVLASEPAPEFDAPAVDRDSAFVAGRFRSALETFVATARAWGITPVLMTQANRFAPAPPPTLVWREADLGLPYARYRQLYLALNETTRAVAADLDVPLVDLAAEIPPDPRLLYDYVHLTDAGSRRVAALVTDRLAALPAMAASRAAATAGSRTPRRAGGRSRR